MRVITLRILFCLAITASHSRAQSSPPSDPPQSGLAIDLPDTPVGKQLGDFLEAFNTGERKTIHKFIATHFPKPGAFPLTADQMTDANMKEYQRTGGLVVKKVKESSANEIRVFARTKRSDAWVEIWMRVNAKPPHDVEVHRSFPTEAPKTK